MIVPKPLGETTMRDESLIEPYSLDEDFIDGFTDHEISDGLLTFAAYRWRDVEGVKARVAIRRFIMKVSDAKQSHDAAGKTLASTKRRLAVVG